uniref:Uncharacterized protein n=1 Tax=Aegilops tauschii subsp. strangulata TaxID=200361 RepID=A0A453HES5_AEGTS
MERTSLWSRLDMLLDIEGFGAGCIFYDRLVMHGFECCSTGGVQEPPATPSPSSSGLNAAADASGSLEGIGDDAHKAVVSALSTLPLFLWLLRWL